MEYYYGDVMAPSNKLDWITNPRVISNLPELPLRIAKEFVKMMTEPTNRSSFNFFKEHPKV